MRIIKFNFAVWFDPQWFRFALKSALKRGYWFDYRRPAPWTEMVTLGPLRLDVKVEGVLNE